MNNLRICILACLLALSLESIASETARNKVERGIAATQQLIEAHQWNAAFSRINDADRDADTDALHYLCAKQKYNMYVRIKRVSDAADYLARMERLANSSGDAATMEDMLFIKAAHATKTGNPEVSRQCYRSIMQLRSKGMDDNGTDSCYTQLIAEAQKMGNKQMENFLSDMHAAWQDSIAAIRAAEELATLKTQYAEAQADIEDKADTLSRQKTLIGTLGIVLAATVAFIVFLLLMKARQQRTTKKLRSALKISEDQSAQKSAFMTHIVAQISPSLQQVAKGDVATHTTALQRLINDVEEFIKLEESKNEEYETQAADVEKICKQVVADCADKGLPVSCEAPALSFELNSEAVTRLLQLAISECFARGGVERLSLSFKKRNPHTGNFIITAQGLRLEEEQKDTLFRAFAKVYDLTQMTGLVFPICRLMAIKMGGDLKLDPEYTKGTRMVLVVTA